MKVFFKWLKFAHILPPIRNKDFEDALVGRLQRSSCPLNLACLGETCPLTNKKGEEGKPV